MPGAASREDVEEVRPAWWRDPALLPSAIAGTFLLAGYLLEWGALPVLSQVALWVALLAGAWTFVPGALRRLVRGRLGVGLLMTI
ncbi:MAG: heavy metal translocating P-type ATPase, partial [Phenylobacterium zucineum]